MNQFLSSLTILIACISLTLHARETELAIVEVISPDIDSTLVNLSQHRAWLDLLHYHKIGLYRPNESQADDPRFFLSASGKTDPLAELTATYLAFVNSSSDDTSAICRFPARLHWLKTQGLLQNKTSAGCQAFLEWRQKIDAKSLTLAFPAAYMNSPSSMYGHTFIRINRRSGNNPLLDYSINYAANADPEDNELVFSYKGLSGGYPGVFSVLPYYQKVNEYSHLEARDVWEYDLDLTEDEVAQFIRHVWEIQYTHFDYFFFSENCSYHLLTILDTASDRFALSQQFILSAIPADTVRAINDAGLIATSHFRPSTMSILTLMLDETNETIHQRAKQLIVQDSDLEALTSDLSTKQQAQLLELAYQYSRYLSVRKKQDQDKQGKKAISLLSARSKIAETQVFPEYPRPEFRDDQGHHSKRMQLSRGYFQNTHFSQLGLRMAYHDRLDNLPGYLKGAQLEMFHVQLRHSEPKNNQSMIRLENLTLIDIASYTPHNVFVKPLAWEVSTGFKRPELVHDELVSFLSAGWGASSLVGQQQFYALGFFDLQADNDLKKGHHFSAGPKLGWLSQHPSWNLNIEVSQGFDISGQDYDLRRASVGISKSLGLQWQLRFEGSYLSHDQPDSGVDYSKAFQFSLMHYF